MRGPSPSSPATTAIAPQACESIVACVRSRRSRRSLIAGYAGLCSYVFAAVLAPLAHITVEHRAPGPVTAVDPDRCRDVQGNIDLSKLASALGLGDSEPPGPSHTHGPGEPAHPDSNPLKHGLGSAAHFGLSLLTASETTIIPLRAAPPPPPPSEVRSQAPELPRWELDSAWPQGPPV